MKYEIRIEGGQKALKQFNDISKSASKLKENTAQASNNLKNISKAKPPSLGKAGNESKKLGKNLQESNKQLKAIKTLAVADLGLGHLTNSGKKFENILTSIGKESHLSKLKGMFSAFGKGFDRGISSGQGFFSATSRGFKGMAANIKFAMGGMKGLALTIAGTLGPILAVIVAFKLLQRMWQLNIGGMQSKWGKFMGEIKTSIGKFNAEFNKALRALSPLISFLLEPLFQNLRMLWAVFSGIFKMIGLAIKPIFDAFKEIGDALSEIFGGSNKNQAKAFETTLKIISGIFTVLGKTLGFIVKTALSPLVIGFKSLAFVFKWISSFPIWEKMGKQLTKLKDIFLGVKDTIMGQLQSIWDFILGIINKIPNVLLPKSIQQLKTAGSETAKTNRNETNNIRNINNNQNMIFNTGRATTPDQSKMFAELLVQELSR